MLGDVVLVLGEAIAGRDIWIVGDCAETVRYLCVLPCSARVDEGDGRFRLAWMKRILDRGLHRLVVLGERPVNHGGGEEAPHAFAVHDERQPRRRTLGVRSRTI